MLAFSLTLLVTVILSFLPERWIKPKLPRLTLTTFTLQASLVTIVFLALTLIVQRAVFSSIAIFIFLIILVAVNNAKYKALKEPMVFSDFAMFSQAFKHPRLYFPFLGLLPVILAPVIIIGLIITVLKLEPALAFTWQRIVLSIFTIIILFFISKKIAASLKISSNPEEDNSRYGLQNSLYAYALYAMSDTHKQKIIQALKSSAFYTNSNGNKDTTPPIFTSFPNNTSKHKEIKPNITVIQSESFFDARRLHPSIKTEVLKNFDEICAESLQYGQLEVPAWGANTMRTEFSFLSGIDNKKMGLYRFYPYQFINKLPLSSIASALKVQGYYCICIHPHPASFFGRDRLFPTLGFDEFIDIDSFSDAKKFGPYISDQSVTDKIIEISKEKTDKPLFMFVITMENHGPLHLEKTTVKEQETYFSNHTLKDINDLTVYLRHLKNTDKMLKQLTTNFTKSDKPQTLCFYGDHIPSMPNIYTLTNYKNHNSDYLIWTNDKLKKTKQNTIAVENLANKVIKSCFFKKSSAADYPALQL